MSMPSLFDPDPDTSDVREDDEFDYTDTDAEGDGPDDDVEDDEEEDEPDDDTDTDAEGDGPDDDVEDDEEEDEPEPDDQDEDEADPDEDMEDEADDPDDVEDDDEADYDEVDPTTQADNLREERNARMSDLVLEYKHWTNPRRFTGLDQDDLSALGADIKSKTYSIANAESGAGLLAGIKTPLEVVRIKGPNGSTIQLVIDGQRRYKAIEMALGNGAPGSECHEIWIKVVDLEMDPVDWTEDLAKKYLAQVLSDVGQRQGLSAYEIAEAARSLRGTKDLDTGKELTIAAIAAKINRSPSWTSKIFTAMDNASPKLIQRWRTGEITEEMFRDLATGVADKAQQDEQAEKLAEARKGGDKGAARLAAKEAAELAKQKKAAEREQKKREAEEKRAAAKAAKEAAQAAKANRKGKNKEPTTVRGPQADLPMQAQPTAKADKPDADKDKGADKPDKSDKPDKAAKPKPLPFAVIEDMVDQSKRKPPTHELVRGVVLGLQVAAGLLMMEELPKPWHAYIHHLAGTKPDKKPGKKVRRK